MSRSGEAWERPPGLPETHFVDPRICSAPTICACHESELPSAHDYRTFQHPAGVSLVAVRGADGAVRAFYNVCPHRGNVLVHDPAGNARALTCIFHAWTFDSAGH